MKNPNAFSSNTANNDEELRRLMTKRTNYILKNVAQASAEELYKNTKTLFYDAYSPKAYERTYEFLNSITIDAITKVREGQYETSVGFSPEEIKTFRYPKGRMWGTHVSLGKRKITSFWETYVEMMENGWEVHSFSRDADFAFHMNPRAGMIKATQNWVDSKLDGLVSSAISTESATGIDFNMNRSQKLGKF